MTNTPNGINRRSFLWGSGAVLGASALAACSSSGSSGTASSGASGAAGKARKGGNLRIALVGNSADSIDPNKVASGGASGPLIVTMYDGLTRFEGASMAPQPCIAEQLIPDKSATVWQLKVRQGVKFHDGRTVTADDVVFSINRAVKGGPFAAQIGKVAPNGVTKVDAQTVQVKLTAPNSLFPSGATQIYVVPQDFDVTKPVGTGPFKYGSFVAGQQTVMTRNDDYWMAGGKPYLDQLTFIDFADTNAVANALLGGQADFGFDLPAAQIPALKSRLSSVSFSTAEFQTIGMNTSTPEFADARVRQAFRLLADRQQIVEQVYAGQATVANDLFAPYDPAFNSTLAQRTPDVAQAKSLLKQAGMLGHKFTLTTAATAADIVSMATVFAQQATDAGVSVHINKVDTSTYYGPQYNLRPLSTGFWPGLPIVPQILLSLSPDAPFNQTHWKDPEFDQLLSQAMAEVSATKRNNILGQLQKVWWERGTYIIPAFMKITYAFNASVGGVRPQNTTVFPYFQYMWMAS